MARLLLVLVVLTLMVTVSAAAQQPDLDLREREFAAAINDPLTVHENERLGVVVSIHNETLIAGTVLDALIIIDGTATITGEVTGEIVAFSSHIVIAPGARVNNVSLQNSTIDLSPGATVLGAIESHGNFFLLEWWSSPIFALVFWVLTTLFLLAGGVIFTLAAGQQFPTFVRAATRHIGGNLVTGLVIWIGVPIVAVLVMFTLIGIPLGLVLLGLVLPGLWRLGYTLIGARVGSMLLKPFARDYSIGTAVLATVIGVLLLQLLTLLPYVGGLAIFISGAYGSGALVYHLIKGRQDRPLDPELVDFGPEFARAPGEMLLRD